MARALEADHDAFAALFRRHGPDVHAFAQRRTRSVDLADEVIAATFEKVWRSLDRLGAKHGDRFRPWVFRIAANELASIMRSGARRARREHLAAVRGEVAADGEQAERQADVFGSTDDGAVVLDALGRLSDRHQEVISLRYLSDLSPDETAEALGIAKGHVAVRLHRAMAALRSEIEAVGRRSS